MRLFLLPALFVLSTMPAAGDDKADADLKAMVGKWQITKAELGGKDLTEHLKAMKFEITEGGKYTAQLGEEKDAGSFTVDPAKSPRQMTHRRPRDGHHHEGRLHDRRRRHDHLLRPQPRSPEAPGKVREQGRHNAPAHHLQANEVIVFAPTGL